ncbi:MAG: TadE/TadG family type IV pilus assembly protein, partial [Chloroflexota bacterium]
MVEFAICIPVFLLFVFGIFQAVLIYKTQLALNQAAMDAAQVISAQSSDDVNDSSGALADAGGLAALRAGLASVDLSNLSGMCSDGSSPNSTTFVCGNGGNASGIDIFSDDGSGNAKTNVPVNIS